MALGHGAMAGAGPVQMAKRALVSVLLRLAGVYTVALAVTRDSADAVVEGAFKKLLLRVHPDKGGHVELLGGEARPGAQQCQGRLGRRQHAFAPQETTRCRHDQLTN